MDEIIKHDHEVLWQMNEYVKIVNDNVFKADSTFVYEEIDPLELKDDNTSLNIVIGPYYHANGSKLDRLVNVFKVSAVLNL